jgi:hypothetical protein
LCKMDEIVAHISFYVTFEPKKDSAVVSTSQRLETM